MAHFLKPVGAPPDCYTVDNKLAPGSLAQSHHSDRWLVGSSTVGRSKPSCVIQQ